MNGPVLDLIERSARWRGDQNFGCRSPFANAYADRMATVPDYYIVTRETSEHPSRWCWEIRRRSKPMGVNIGRNGYLSQAAAEYAGARGLAFFLEQLAKKERRR
jgi:hypothetical protein